MENANLPVRVNDEQGWSTCKHCGGIPQRQMDRCSVRQKRLKHQWQNKLFRGLWNLSPKSVRLRHFAHISANWPRNAPKEARRWVRLNHHNNVASRYWVNSPTSTSRKHGFLARMLWWSKGKFCDEWVSKKLQFRWKPFKNHQEIPCVKKCPNQTFRWASQGASVYNAGTTFSSEGDKCIFAPGPKLPHRHRPAYGGGRFDNRLWKSRSFDW